MEAGEVAVVELVEVDVDVEVEVEVEVAEEEVEVAENGAGMGGVSGRILVETVPIAKRKVEEADTTVTAPRDSLASTVNIQNARFS